MKGLILVSVAALLTVGCASQKTVEKRDSQKNLLVAVKKSNGKPIEEKDVYRCVREMKVGSHIVSMRCKKLLADREEQRKAEDAMREIEHRRKSMHLEGRTGQK